MERLLHRSKQRKGTSVQHVRKSKTPRTTRKKIEKWKTNPVSLRYIQQQQQQHIERGIEQLETERKKDEFEEDERTKKSSVRNPEDASKKKDVEYFCMCFYFIFPDQVGQELAPRHNE